MATTEIGMGIQTTFLLLMINIGAPGLPLENMIKDGRSPDARLRFARLTLARLRLNDGAKLWVFLQTLLQNNSPKLLGLLK